MRFVLKRKWHGRRVKKTGKGLFGGNIKSMAEIREMSDKIKQKEAAELQKVEAHIDAELKNL